MKITVLDDTGGKLGALQIRIKDLSVELERITVKVLGLHLPARPSHHASVSTRSTHNVRSRSASRKQFQRNLFARMLGATRITQFTRPPQPTPHARAQSKTIEIKLPLLVVPEWAALARIGRKLVSLPTTYKVLIGALAIALIVLVGNNIFGGNAGNTGHGLNHSGAPLLTRGTPNYHTILPAGKSISGLGGWARVSPPDSDPVYAFIDHTGQTQLNVSEQPLPKSFKSDTAAQVAKLAQSFSATNQLTAGDVTVHIGTSVQGTQSVIFSKSQLLILIRSASPLADSQWIAYVNSLQ